MNVPVAPTLPAESEGVYGPAIPSQKGTPITDFVSTITDFVSRKPVTSALIALGAYLIIR